MIPPASPTTAASTTAPKMSSPRRTAAMPPLIPNTNVPARLSTRISVGEKPLSNGRAPRALCRQPSARSRHERLYAGLERRVDHRGELGVVVGGQLAEPPLALGLGVRVRIDAADEPEHRRHMPLHPEGAEVLTGGCRTCLGHPLIAEVRAQ